MAKVTYKGPTPLDDPIYKVGFIIGGKRLGKLKTKNLDKEQSDDQKNKLELIAITPGMSKEEIRLNLLRMLKKQGIEVKENTNEKK